MKLKEENLPKEAWERREIQYDTTNNIIYIDAEEVEFDPTYFNYLLEHLKLPKDATRVFIRDLATN